MLRVGPGFESERRVFALRSGFDALLLGEQRAVDGIICS